MLKQFSSKWFEYLLWFISALLFIVGISTENPKTIITFTLASLASVLANLWLKNDLCKVSYDKSWIHITKGRKEIQIPLEKAAWISELPGGGISICFMGFKGSTIFGDKIVFIQSTYTQSVRELVSTAAERGVTIEHIRPW
jgi:hypothetical protein